MAAFPVVQTTASSGASATSSHAVTMPAGIVAGDRLVVFFTLDDDETVDTPSGWTKSLDTTTSGQIRLVVYTKVAAGSDSLTVTTSANTDSSHTAYRIVSDGDIYVQATNGSSTSADPASFTPAGGSQKYLWIAACAANAVTVTAYPTNYTNDQESDTTAVENLYSATDTVEAATENVGAFTLSGSAPWITAVVAVGEQSPIEGNFPIVTQSSSVIQPTINFAADASFTILTSSSSIIQPTATASTKTVWTNESQISTTWTNETKV